MISTEEQTGGRDRRIDVETQFRWRESGLEVALNLRSWSCQLVVLDAVTAARWIEWASATDADYFAGLDDWRNPWDASDASLLEAPPARRPLPTEWFTSTPPRLLTAVAEWDWPDTGGYCTASTITVSEADLRTVLGEATVDAVWKDHQADEQAADQEYQQAMDEQAASVERRYQVRLVDDQWVAYDERGALLGTTPATPDEHGRYHPARDEFAEEFCAAMPGEADYQPVPNQDAWWMILPW